MAGWAEEVYESLLQVALCNAQTGKLNTDDFLEAFNFNPNRAESFFWLARYYSKKPQLRYLFAKLASQIPMPQDKLFVEPAIYEWRALDEYAVAAYWTGHYQESLDACQKLLNRAPESQRARIEKNLKYAEAKLADK
jgi:tetratricopeptide (TPR) repeat protein